MDAAVPLLDVRALSRGFAVRGRRRLQAVRQVSFVVSRGETLALVGESGCGKSTLGRLILRLLRPDSGSVHFDGTDLSALSSRQLRPWRRRMQVVFQDPYSALNPRRTVRATLVEALRLHGLLGARSEQEARVADLLQRVGLPAAHMHRYPHEFSGGQRQRIGIARALAVEPEFVVADEPVSALDVSVQAQVIGLLQQLQAEAGLSYLFISHDLHVVRLLATRVAVMYLGALVEVAPAAALFLAPRHPYTRALIDAAPTPHVVREAGRRLRLWGDPPSPIDLPQGCAFHPRCPAATDRCRSGESPPLRPVQTGHWVACHFDDGVQRALEQST